MKSQPTTYVTFLFFFEIQYLFENFFFEERTFLPFITIDCNNNYLCDGKQRKTIKNKFDSHKKNSRMNNVRIIPLKPQRFFMKKSTHVQSFEDLANLVKGRILRNSLKCLQMIFLCFFSQQQYCNIKN